MKLRPSSSSSSLLLALVVPLALLLLLPPVARGQLDLGSSPAVVPWGYDDAAEPSRAGDDKYADSKVDKAGYGEEDYPAADVLQERDYKPTKPKCHPQTITKYRTVFKDRKANVFNKVEVRNPRPQVHKTKETRHTTIRYPVFITQVIKPLLTQVETKVKPMFFTKTLKRVKTIVFTVTGIGQVTVTSVKYEKEYVTRCQKKKKKHGGYHRRQDYDDPQAHDDADYVEPEYVRAPSYNTERIVSYEDIYRNRYKRDLSQNFDFLAPSMTEVSGNKATAQITDPLPSV